MSRDESRQPFGPRSREGLCGRIRAEDLGDDDRVVIDQQGETREQRRLLAALGQRVQAVARPSLHRLVAPEKERRREPREQRRGDRRRSNDSLDTANRLRGESPALGDGGRERGRDAHVTLLGEELDQRGGGVGDGPWRGLGQSLERAGLGLRVDEVEVVAVVLGVTALAEDATLHGDRSQTIPGVRLPGRDEHRHGLRPHRGIVGGDGPGNLAEDRRQSRGVLGESLEHRQHAPPDLLVLVGEQRLQDADGRESVAVGVTGDRLADREARVSEPAVLGVPQSARDLEVPVAVDDADECRSQFLDRVGNPQPAVGRELEPREHVDEMPRRLRVVRTQCAGGRQERVDGGPGDVVVPVSQSPHGVAQEPVAVERRRLERVRDRVEGRDPDPPVVVRRRGQEQRRVRLREARLVSRHLPQRLDDRRSDRRVRVGPTGGDAVQKRLDAGRRWDASVELRPAASGVAEGLDGGGPNLGRRVIEQRRDRVQSREVIGEELPDPAERPEGLTDGGRVLAVQIPDEAGDERAEHGRFARRDPHDRPGGLDPVFRIVVGGQRGQRPQQWLHHAGSRRPDVAQQRRERAVVDGGVVGVCERSPERLDQRRERARSVTAEVAKRRQFGPRRDRSRPDRGLDRVEDLGRPLGLRVGGRRECRECGASPPDRRRVQRRERAVDHGLARDAPGLEPDAERPRRPVEHGQASVENSALTRRWIVRARVSVSAWTMRSKYSVWVPGSDPM